MKHFTISLLLLALIVSFGCSSSGTGTVDNVPLTPDFDVSQLPELKTLMPRVPA